MTNKKQKLELAWIGKEIRSKLEPRILLEDRDKSYHAPHRVSDDDIFDNRLIFGDNLLALKALEQEFAGRIQCIYIDPPFNTGQAFEHYDDSVEHSLWLSLMRDRIELLYTLLHPSGSFFAHIDDNELGYLIAVADEIFGRSNRISVIAFKQSSASGPKAINPGLVTTTNFIVYYAKDRSKWKSFKTFVSTSRDDRYSKVIENFSKGYAEWRLVNLKEAFSARYRAGWNELRSKFADKIEAKLEEFVLTNAERVVRTARVAPRDVNESARTALQLSTENPGKVYRSERSDKEDYYFLNGEQLVFYKAKTKLIDGRLTTAAAATNVWDDILSNNLHKEGGVSFPNGKKPEALIKRILELSTEPGDIVLDSFAGSGTTGAAVHKMGRRWIMVELGEHCHTHILPRLRKVVDGIDQDGISKVMNWKGGGGFRYYRLAPSLLEKDGWGNWIINKKYNPSMLAEALCKLEGFTYAPSDTIYWQHGYSTEQDFLYITTHNLSHAQLQQLSDEVGENRSLLVLCTAFRGKPDAFSNLTVRKIPRAVLHRCEWGHDDYSLRVENLPQAPPEPSQKSLFSGEGQ
jgi:adenine-specific DNA-methyltransferase